MRLRHAAMGIVLALASTAGYCAGISVPTFELYTRGYLDSGTFKLGTYGNIDLDIGGGAKFAGNLSLNFTGNNVGDLGDLAASHLTFKEASVTINRLFNTPIALTYFTGYDDTFANGDIFPTEFGTQPIATRYRGYLYFPAGTLYDGIYTVAGTGLKVSLPAPSKEFSASAYLYQDANLGAGYYASDLRAVFNSERLKLDAFAGASFPVSTAGIYRAGALLYYDTGAGGSFLTEIGVPRWDPVKDSLNAGLFYLLFEPRVDFGSFAVIPTLFWHPAYYNDQATGEVPTSNINIDFRFGNPLTDPTTGGFETELDYLTTSSSRFNVLLSPYLSVVASGVLWSFKINVKLFPLSLSDIAEGFVGVQTAF